MKCLNCNKELPEPSPEGKRKLYSLAREMTVELQKEGIMPSHRILGIGDITGYREITKPDNHSWKSFCNLLLQTMPKKTREHYIYRFRKFIYGWKRRGYEIIPDESPPELESKCWAPSWRRMCKALLRNDYWCKGLGQAQPKSEAYQRFKELMKAKKLKENN